MPGFRISSEKRTENRLDNRAQWATHVRRDCSRYTHHHHPSLNIKHVPVQRQRKVELTRLHSVVFRHPMVAQACLVIPVTFILREN